MMSVDNSMQDLIGCRDVLHRHRFGSGFGICNVDRSRSRGNGSSDVMSLDQIHRESVNRSIC